jgi:hypothetical protein
MKMLDDKEMWAAELEAYYRCADTLTRALKG